MKSDKKQTERMDREHLRPEKASTRRDVKKDEGKQPPKKGMGAVGATMGKSYKKKVRDT